MQQTNDQFIKLINVLLFFLILYHYEVIGQDLDEDLIPDLYAKYEEAVRSNDTNTDENTVSLRRIFRNDKEYKVHVKKLQEVNGYKKHNLMIKSILRSNDTIIYINNPVESKIPNAYLTLEEFKKVLALRINSKKDAYSILHKPKRYDFHKTVKIIPPKELSLKKHKIPSHILLTSLNTTTLQRSTVKIKLRKTTVASRTTVTIFTKVQKEVENKITTLVVPNVAKFFKNISKPYNKSKNMTKAVTHSLETTIQETTVQPNQMENTERNVENKNIVASLSIITYENTSKKIVDNITEQDVTKSKTTKDDINIKLEEYRNNTVIAPSTENYNIFSTQKEKTKSEVKPIEIRLNESNIETEIDNVTPNVLKSSKNNLDLNKTNEINLNSTDSNINEERKDVNESVVNLNATESNLNDEKKDINDGIVNIADKATISDTTETTTEGIVTAVESSTEETEPFRWGPRKRKRLRTTTKATTKRTRRTYGRPRVFMGR